jgi:cation diffusion facilitator family transporter
MQDVKERVALTSILASASLTLAKGVVGIFSGSLALLSEAGHSLLDLVATVITYFAVRVSGQPADERHQYGHGKIESIAALAATSLLFLLSGVVVFEAMRRLLGMGDHAVDASIWAFAVIILSIVVDFFRARVLYRVADETSSEALEADALHFGSDMWSSIAVLVGLFGVLAGYAWADAVAALVVAVFVLIAGWRLASRTIETLTDVAPAGVAGHVLKLAQTEPGVVEVERVRVRRAGAVLFADLDLAVSRTLPLDRINEIKGRVAAKIRTAHPAAEVNITTTPRALKNETVLERVLVIARNQALAVHHVTVHAVGDKLAVSLDLEVDGRLTLAEAHDIASRLEEAVENELGAEVEVETHIEPLQLQDALGHDAPPERTAELHEALAGLAAQLGPLRDVHDVRVRTTSDGEIVNFHCYVEPGLTVDAVHDHVDDVERALRRRWPTVKRVIGHAEPRPARPA